MDARFLQEGGLESEGFVVKGAWIALQTCLAYALLDVSDPTQVYRVFCQWSEIGEIELKPVIPNSTLRQL